MRAFILLAVVVSLTISVAAQARTSLAVTSLGKGGEASGCFAWVEATKSEHFFGDEWVIVHLTGRNTCDRDIDVTDEIPEFGSIEYRLFDEDGVQLARDLVDEFRVPANRTRTPSDGIPLDFGAYADVAEVEIGKIAVNYADATPVPTLPFLDWLLRR